MRISIGKAANILGVSKQTLRRWETQGKIKVLRTPQNHRRYEISSIHGFSKKPTLNTKKITIGYARVRTHSRLVKNKLRCFSCDFIDRLL